MILSFQKLITKEMLYMKKVVALILSAAIPLSCISLGVTASADEAPALTFESKEIEVTNEGVVLDCIFRSDLPEIPFVNVDDYLDQLFIMDKEPENIGNGVYSFENGGNKMTLNAENDVVSIDSYEGFVSSNPKNNNGYRLYPFIEDGNGMEYVGEFKGVEFDLSKYGIDVVEQNDNIYLPFCTLNDIFEECSFVLTYKKEKFKLENTNTLMGSKGSLADRTKEYAEFSYNEFCFSTDCFHGRPSNALITKSIGEIGLDKTLDTYNTVTPRIKELLLSESIEDYCTGLELLQYYVDDGGHTHLDYSIKSRLSNYGISDPASAAKKAFGDSVNDDVAAILSSKDNVTTAYEQAKAYVAQKSEAYKTFEKINDWQCAALYRKGDTFIFDLGYFDVDCVEPFKEAMDIAGIQGAKYFIVDVTSNSGGDPIVAGYMLSLMCDNVTFTEQHIVSGNKTRFTGRYDKNLDGEYNEKDDELKYDFRCAVLGNLGSYSCPNEFACIAQDCGVCVIGERTSGGSCCVTTRLLTTGTSYNVSGYSMFLRENGKDTDEGVQPDIPMPGNEEGYEGFFNIDKMRMGISEFYGDPTPQLKGICGDLDGDNSITSADALFVLRISIGLEAETAENKNLADVDFDGMITSSDALAILRYSIGMSEENSRINNEIAA